MPEIEFMILSNQVAIKKMFPDQDVETLPSGVSKLGEFGGADVYFDSYHPEGDITVKWRREEVSEGLIPVPSGKVS